MDSIVRRQLRPLRRHLRRTMRKLGDQVLMALHQVLKRRHCPQVRVHLVESLSRGTLDICHLDGRKPAMASSPRRTALMFIQRMAPNWDPE